jgi:hypothetical protein
VTICEFDEEETGANAIYSWIFEHNLGGQEYFKWQQEHKSSQGGVMGFAKRSTKSKSLIKHFHLVY